MAGAFKTTKGQMSTTWQFERRNEDAAGVLGGVARNRSELEVNRMHGRTLSPFEECRRVPQIERQLDPPAAAMSLSILVVENDPCDALLLEQAFYQADLHVPTNF